MSQVQVEDVRNIHAVGRNYVAHAAELGNAVPNEPVLFSKAPASLTTGPDLYFPNGLAPIHFELELVLRLGRDLPLGTFHNLDCISHIGLGIDFTARGLQKNLKKQGLPWDRAKSFQNSCYLGPMRDDVLLNQDFHFQLFQNDWLRQDGNSRLVLFDFTTRSHF